MGYSPDQDSEFEQSGFTAPIDKGFSADEKLMQDMQNEEKALAESFGEQAPEDEEQSGEKPHSTDRRKRKNPFQKRIDQLVYEKGAVEQNNAFLAQQLAEKEAFLAQQMARMADYEQRLNQSDRYANESFENSLEFQEKALKDKLRQAKENGDIDNEIEIIDQLAELKSTKTTHEAWKLQEEGRRQEQLYNEPYVPYETNVEVPYQMQQAPDVEFQEWVSENPWYRTPNLKHEADAMMHELSNIFTFNNQQHLIGTAEFYDIISDEMNKKYGQPRRQQQHDHDEEEYQMPNYAPRSNPVAPVSRSSSMAHNYMNQRGGERVGRALTREEYDMARYLPRKGQSESEMDLIKRYQKAKNYPKSPLPGGSAYRLTIM